ncbi:MAG: nylA [Deltaproteobacteria bacterium]|nr:nylA [Deltaproteobacteria bacterium]
MAFAEYASYDALGLAALVAAGAVAPAELVEEAITRIERHNPVLNAIVYKMYDQARAVAARQAARGRDAGRRFRGVPFLLKDILGNYEGVPTTAGCRFMTGVAASRDDTLVTRFKAAGLIAVGKTTTPECGLLPTTEPLLYGPCHNPWSLQHSAGGSSGGSAAAVAAGIVPLAHANDGGGSIRIPAACCGLVGIKPTRARNPLGPDIGDLASGLIVEHVVSRTVRDSAAVLDCTHGAEPGDPYCAPPVARPFLDEVATPPERLHIAFSTRGPDGNPVHPECVKAVEVTAKRLEELGHTVEEAGLDLDNGAVTSAFMAVFMAGHAAMIDGFALVNGRTPTASEFEPATWSVYENGKQVSAPQYLLAVARLQMAARQAARFHQRFDCWLTPTLGRPPIPLGTIDARKPDFVATMAAVLDYMPFTPIQNATGQPAISLPLHWSSDGLPVGVMFTGRFGDEATLFRLAGQLEEACPWRDRKPLVWD